MTQPTPLDSITPTELRAFVEIVLLVAYADGRFVDAEKDRLVSRLFSLSGEKLDRDELDRMVTELHPASRRAGEERSDQVRRLKAALPSEIHRKTAFVVALEVAHADGGIGVREGSTLAATAMEFGLRSEEALELLRAAQLG